MCMQYSAFSKKKMDILAYLFPKIIDAERRGYLNF